MPIIESSPNSENVTLPSTPRSTSVSLKLNDGHSPMSGCGGQSLPSTPSETQAEALPTPPATVHTAYTDHTRQSSVHSLLGTGGEDKANGFANGHTGHSDDAVGRPDSSWQPAAPQYTPSGAIFGAPQLHKSPSQVTLLLDHDLRTAETTRIRDGVRRLAEVMASFDDTGHGSRPAQAGHAHSHSCRTLCPVAYLTACQTERQTTNHSTTFNLTIVSSSPTTATTASCSAPFPHPQSSPASTQCKLGSCPSWPFGRRLSRNTSPVNVQAKSNR